MAHSYKTTYPYFLHLTRNMRYKVNRRIQLGKPSENELPFLFDLLNQIETLEKSFVKRPSVSNVNFEKSINSLVSKDKEIDGILIRVFIRGKEAKKWGQIEFHLK